MRPFLIRHTQASPADPAAIITPSPLDWWQLISIQVTLAASATVATRVLFLEITDASGAIIATIGARLTVAAGSTTNYRWAGNSSPASLYVNATANSQVIMPAPAERLPPGAQIRLRSLNLQADDVLSNLVASIEVMPSTP